MYIISSSSPSPLSPSPPSSGTPLPFVVYVFRAVIVRGDVDLSVLLLEMLADGVVSLSVGIFWGWLGFSFDEIAGTRYEISLSVAHIPDWKCL